MDYNTFKTEIYNTCIALFKEGIGKYNYFVKNGEYDKQLSIIPTREEYTVNSKYLHRGYYCPSPLLDDLIDNTRKGVLHSGKTKRKKISNRYLYNSKDELYLVEHYYPNITMPSREFIYKEGDKRYGLSFYDSGELFAISIESYRENKLQSYVNINCLESKPNGIFEMTTLGAIRFLNARYETYTYVNNVIVQWDVSEAMYEEGREPYQLVFHDQYIPIYENENVVSFEHVKLK